jgi:hypothetical protein
VPACYTCRQVLLMTEDEFQQLRSIAQVRLYVWLV